MLSITCNFGYYLINFYIKYIPGDFYVNQIVNSLSESMANGPLSIIVIQLFSVKNGYFINLVFCGMSCMLIFLSTVRHWDMIIPFAVLGAKSSISIAFCFLYFSTIQFFDS